MVRDKRILAAAILYSLWIVFYILNFYLEFVSLPQNISAWVFMGTAAALAILAGFRIAELKYSPVILLVFFILCGRLTAFSADYLSFGHSGSRLFMIPFSGFDFFLYHLLFIGLLMNILRRPTAAGETASRVFSPLSLIPLVLLVLPVMADLVPYGINGLTLYSLGFTAVAVWSLGYAVHFGVNRPGMREFAFAAGTAVVLDMLVYAGRFDIPFKLPGELNHLFLPYAFLLLAGAAVNVKQEDLND